jgi:hypothetical protein
MLTEYEKQMHYRICWCGCLVSKKNFVRHLQSYKHSEKAEEIEQQESKK